MRSQLVLTRRHYSLLLLIALSPVSLLAAPGALASAFDEITTDSYGNSCTNGICTDSVTGQTYQEGTAPPCSLPSVNVVTPADGQGVSGIVQMTFTATPGTFSKLVISAGNGYNLAVYPADVQFSGNRGFYSWNSFPAANAVYRVEAFASNSCGDARQAHTITLGNPVVPSFQVVGLDSTSTIAKVATSFTALSSLQPDCTALQPFSGACSSGINRLCTASGFSSGYGPIEYSGDQLLVNCFQPPAAANVPTSFTEIEAAQSLCDPSQPLSDSCWSGANRVCQARGYAAGFGPVEYAGDSAVVTCMSSAFTEFEASSFSELQQYHADCNAGSPVSAPCNAAIERYCTARSFIGGMGVLEHAGDAVRFGCFK